MFDSNLDHVSYTSETYIFKTQKSEPNEYMNFYNVVYIFININYI